MPDRFKHSRGFHKKTLTERQRWLIEHRILDQEDVDYLQQSICHPSTDIIDAMIENVIGHFHLPIGIVPYICVNNQTYTVPLVVEETSIVAALNKTSKALKHAGGSLCADYSGPTITGQIVFSRMPPKAIKAIEELVKIEMDHWIQSLKQGLLKGIDQRGGGLNGWSFKTYPMEDGSLYMASLFIQLNSVDAMGANLITQTAEWIGQQIQTSIAHKPLFSIVCNHSELAMVDVHCDYPMTHEIGQKIADASWFATQDVARASTHNKGIMNAIDGLMIATGNDWRAVESAMHTHASISGQYQPLSRWNYDQGCLKGHMQVPIQIGTVGGVTGIHPDAQLCLKMLDINSSSELAMIAGSIGLLQNLAALTALVDDGITAGHMRLHIDNLMLACQANEQERHQLKPILTHHLKQHRSLSKNDVMNYLQQLTSS